ncbi:translation elongation factor Ts [soil metagenome]
MSITAADVKALRDITGAGMMDCKRALSESNGDVEAAKDLLKKWGLAGIEKRSSRVAKEGTIAHYIHQLDPELPPKKGVLVELNSETDFVAKTPEFKELARSIAMHVAAMDPKWVSRSEVPADFIERETAIFKESDQLKAKPEHIQAKIIEGKLNALLSDRGGVLLEQKFVKDESGKKTVGDLIADYAAAVKENIGVRRFARFAVGE